ncbi:WD40-repeat-containing domain protein [Butyriboletus roseoflavus]|nr:WD40-repeat-containing domain protein [Butyriboletus roseoflavus]
MAPSRGPQTLARKLHTTLDNHRGPVHVVRYARGSAKYILSGGQDRTVRLWNPDSGAQIKSFEAHGYEVLSISVSHDNAKFASSGGDRSVFVWDVATGVTTRRLAGHMGKVHVVEFNADASVLASGSYDATIRLWDLRPVRRSRCSTRPAMPCKPSTSARRASLPVPWTATSAQYDLRKGELRTDFVGQPVTSVVPSADATTLLVATLDSHVRLFDAATGKLLNAFTGHAHMSYRCHACFGHEEASVVCGDENGQVWAWDLVDAAVLQPNPPPKVHNKVITWTEHHPSEAGEMITASADGTVKVWRQT